MKKHNFSAGPSILPEFTIEETIKAIQNFAGTGLSILEVSHRSKEFEAVIEEASSLFLELLGAPAGYKVVFVGGGASTQFAYIPQNFMKTKAGYVNTGVWASKAIKEAKLFGEVVDVASSKDKNFNYIPRGYTIPTDLDYLHITTNNTIYGTELKTDIDCPVPLVADMSSDIFSRPIDVSKYAMIYGGAQKNLAPAGVTFVVVKEDLLGKVDRVLPSMVDYRTHIENGSMFNTPPCVIIYSALMTMKWLKNMGGVEVMQRKNIEKAGILYNEIERNKLFVPNVSLEEDRSLMNITFVMNPDYMELEKYFLTFATNRGMDGLKGHRSVGGFRASTYNALPRESVEALVAVMQEFERSH
ncbi:MAG: 3-phosphoserine/phosphohydroxythreonine transaminase [Bacteroidetes bacterium]|nr:3-phosphoserine/phosphohydroxythreonine transaminase [Bacteroidota bacterium]